MEKPSLNIKSFRNLLSNQSKSYKIPPDSYQPTEVKFMNGTIIDNAANRSIEDMYSIKHRKSNAVNDEGGCDRRRRRQIHDIICANLVNFFSNYNKNFFLTFFTPISSSICVIIVIAALFGTSWISTEEKIPWLQVNSSFYRTNNFSVSYVIKSSNASLWIICTRLALNDNHTKSDFTHKNCTRIDYFDVDKYQPDPRDSTNDCTNVIPYTITLSSPLLIISFIILLISYLLFLLAICSQKYKIFYFVAGILFIISGLLMLSGLIMFISIFKAEVFHKLRPSNMEPVFNFHYGHSFILYVLGFIAVELAGILNVCLFNKLQKAEELNQNRYLNNYIKPPGHSSLSSTASNHHNHIVYPNIENGYIPRNNLHCSLHTTSSTLPSSMKVTNDYSSMPLRTKSPHHHIMNPTNRFNAFNHVPFTRNASTSTLDLDNEADVGDCVSMKSSHNRIGKDKSSTNNKLDFNNICGMMRSNKSKDCNANSSSMYHRMKPAKNIYYIKDQNDEDEPNIFIVDPRFYKNRKCALQKSLEDIRMQKMNNTYTSPSQYRHTCNGLGHTLLDRSFHGSKTLPRDFTRPKHVRPSLGNFLENFYQDTSENRLNQSTHNHNHLSHHNLQSHCHQTGYPFHHHNSYDELSTLKLNRNTYCRNFMEPQHIHQAEYQWPKVIPKSPSSYSMNSFRINRLAAFDDGTNYNPIEEFDLDKIENERRKSHTNLFKECRQNDFKKEFGTAV